MINSQEKILLVYNKITEIDNQIIAMDYENKSEEDSLLFMNLVFGKKAMLNLLEELGVIVDQEQLMSRVQDQYKIEFFMG